MLSPSPIRLPLCLVLAAALSFVLAATGCSVLQDTCEDTDVDSLSALCGQQDDDDSADDVDDDDNDDDDSASTDDDDDDDDDDTPETITAVTFAATLEGTADPESTEGAELTQLSGTFQFLYWGDLEKQRLVCRQRFLLEATVVFGQSQVDPCPGCGGQVTIMSTQLDAPDSGEDTCLSLPAESDLSFLLNQDDIAVPADFRRLSLVSTEQLIEGQWPLSQSGLPIADVVDSYAAAGFKGYWIAYVEENGWLGQEARLADIAAPWKGEPPLLPMFMLYRNQDSPNQSWDMVGSCFLSTLWTVRVGPGMGANPLP